MTTRRIRFISLLTFVFISVFTAFAFAQGQAGASHAIARGFADTHAEDLKNLNSPADEATPIISGDEGTLYFTSYRSGGKQVILRSKRKSLTEWGDPELFLEMPEKGNVSALSVAADGRTCVLQGCNLEDGIFKTCDIYQADIEDGQLKNMHPLGKDINSEWWDGQPSISRDGQLLFFSSDRKHGHGSADIYMCVKTSSGTWGEPVNLSFNTSGNEVSPHIASDNQTLYFADDDLPGGLGGFDIYVTYRKGENEWTEPKNLGPSVNTKYNEMFFSIPATEDAVYLASDRPGGVGNFDLYRIVPNPVAPKPKFIAFHGQVLDAESGQPVRTEPDVSLDVASEKINNTGSPRSYAAMAPIGKLIRVSGGADGYVNGSVEAQAPSVFDSIGFSQDLKLVPAKVKIEGHVTNVFTNKALAAKVILIDDAGGRVDVQTDGNTGSFSFDAKVFGKYKLRAELKDYEEYEAPIEIPLKREALIIVKKEVRLTPSGIPPVMVNFDYNKFDLKEKEPPKMEHFIQQVKENPNVRIEVSGHTDEHGSDEYNLKLSQRRANTVVDYLLSQGVARDQVAIVTGKGKSAPISKESTPEADALNRRVEVRIMGKQ
ncbi:MAG: OmpA family protein [Bacteroidota bacterium]|nr:OmpA family protein [Bacteroidota bacterium]